MPAIDLIVSGSVAVTEDGVRIGKGEGYSDLEFAVLRELDLVGDDTPVATTVHERQVVEDAPADPHDVSMDLIVTPERTVRNERQANPSGVRWNELSEERVDKIPVLDRIRP